MKYKIGDKVLIFGDDFQPVLKIIDFIEIGKTYIIYGFEEQGGLRFEKDVYANTKEYENALKKKFNEYIKQAKELL